MNNYIITYSKLGETIDEIAQRAVGKTAGVVEAMLDLNHNLKDLSAHLPANLELLVPFYSNSSPKEQVLWD